MSGSWDNKLRAKGTKEVANTLIAASGFPRLQELSEVEKHLAQRSQSQFNEVWPRDMQRRETVSMVSKEPC